MFRVPARIRVVALLALVLAGPGCSYRWAHREYDPGMTVHFIVAMDAPEEGEPATSVTVALRCQVGELSVQAPATRITSSADGLAGAEVASIVVPWGTRGISVADEALKLDAKNDHRVTEETWVLLRLRGADKPRLRAYDDPPNDRVAWRPLVMLAGAPEVFGGIPENGSNGASGGAGNPRSNGVSRWAGNPGSNGVSR